MAKVTFDGENKIIEVVNGVTQIDVQNDLYSSWKNWVILSDNAKYMQAFRTFGGDPTSATQSAPKYFFLLNGWKVLVDNDNILVQSNLYTDDGTSPFIVQNNGSVSATNSDAQSIKSDIEDVLAYNGNIYIDTVNGYDGTNYPIGTMAKPVKSLSDAIILANKYNIKSIFLLSALTLTQDVMGLNFKGSNLHILNLNNQLLDNSSINSCIVMGRQNGNRVTYRNCIILTLNNFAGILKECYFALSTPISIQSGSSSIISDCRSGVAGMDSPCLDYSNGNIEISIRAYSGGMRIINSTDSLNVTTIEFIAGKFNIGEDCTDGYFAVRGVCDDTNVNSGGAIVNLNGSVSRISSGLTQQGVRDAMKLSLSDESGIEIGSVEQVIRRVDMNTQP